MKSLLFSQENVVIMTEWKARDKENLNCKSWRQFGFPTAICRQNKDSTNIWRWRTKRKLRKRVADIVNKIYIVTFFMLLGQFQIESFEWNVAYGCKESGKYVQICFHLYQWVSELRNVLNMIIHVIKQHKTVDWLFDSNHI